MKRAFLGVNFQDNHLEDGVTTAINSGGRSVAV